MLLYYLCFILIITYYLLFIITYCINLKVLISIKHLICFEEIINNQNCIDRWHY